MNERIWEGVIEVLRAAEAPLTATARLWRRDDFFGTDWGGQLEIPIALRRALPPGEYDIRLSNGREAHAFIGLGPSNAASTLPTLTGMAEPPFGEAPVAGETDGQDDAVTSAPAPGPAEAVEALEAVKAAESAEAEKAVGPVNAVEAMPRADTAASAAESDVAEAGAEAQEAAAARLWPRAAGGARIGARVNGASALREEAPAGTAAAMAEVDEVDDGQRSAETSRAASPQPESAATIDADGEADSAEHVENRIEAEASQDGEQPEPASAVVSPRRSGGAPSSDAAPAGATALAAVARSLVRERDEGPVTTTSEPLEFKAAAADSEAMAATEALARAFLQALGVRQQLQGINTDGFEGQVLAKASGLLDDVAGHVESRLRGHVGANRRVPQELIVLSWLGSVLAEVPDRGDLQELGRGLRGVADAARTVGGPSEHRAA